MKRTLSQTQPSRRPRRCWWKGLQGRPLIRPHHRSGQRTKFRMLSQLMWHLQGRAHCETAAQITLLTLEASALPAAGCV